MTRYRPDIDGLRAVAVLLVVAFHMDVSLSETGLGVWLGRMLHRPAGFVSLAPKGGFVGVDVFFVISGYLISGILLRQRKERTFSLADFYGRRVRRILPALTVVLLFTLCIALVVLLPDELSQFAQSTIAATLSFSNFYFLQKSSYFDVPSLSQPLLHTWSLSVEEQFYLVFPMLLLLLSRFPRRLLTLVISLLAASSFAANVFLVREHPSAAFYLPFTRAWEFLLGTLLALEVLPSPRSAMGRTLASAIGLGMVLYAGFRFSSATLFPGLAALLPCAGAAFVLASGNAGQSSERRLLSSRPLVAVGKISYSLYLWHWPLLLMNRFEYIHGLQLPKWGLFLLTLTVAALSWRFVEQTFRQKGTRISRAMVFPLAAGCLCLLVGLSGWVIHAKGFPSRVPQGVGQVADFTTSWGGACFVSAPEQSAADNCYLPLEGVRNDLLWGDSHAAHLWWGLTHSFPKIHFEQATASQCKPLLTSTASADSFCRDVTRRVVERTLDSRSIEGVILSAVWTPQDAGPLRDTIRFLRARGLRVYVVGPISFYDQPLPRLLYRAARTQDPDFPARHLALPADVAKFVDDQIAAAAAQAGATRYVSLRMLLCPKEICLHYASPGIPLQYDFAHLTTEGSTLVGQRLREGEFLDAIRIQSEDRPGTSQHR